MPYNEMQEIVRQGSCPTRKLSDKTQPNDTRICRRTSVSDKFSVGQIPPTIFIHVYTASPLWKEKKKFLREIRMQFKTMLTDSLIISDIKPSEWSLKVRKYNSKDTEMKFKRHRNFHQEGKKSQILTAAKTSFQNVISFKSIILVP